METKATLRRGWTTGACATAAAKAAYIGLVSGRFPDPVEITLPLGKTVPFALARTALIAGGATAGVVKDAGDDPDVTHGVLVLATVYRSEPGKGVSFRAGPGVGTITKPGLPLGIGEPAINPIPRSMMRETIAQVAAHYGETDDVLIEIAIPRGNEIAEKTMNARLGIVGGLSILGTTGIVIPYSCAAWIATIHEGVDVARALGLDHIAGSTGSTSEAAVAKLYDLPESALIEMGDFVGGMLKYLQRKPVSRVTIAGGFAKIAKLAQGALDLHSDRSKLDLAALGALTSSRELEKQIGAANTGLQAWHLARSAGFPLADIVASRARQRALECIKDAPITLNVLVIDRDGTLSGRSE